MSWLKQMTSSTVVYELRTQELVERLHRALAAHVAQAPPKPTPDLLFFAGVGGHDYDGVFKVHGAPLRVESYATVIQDLEEDAS